MLATSMNFERHLLLLEATLAASAEWFESVRGWTLVRVSEGAAYWMGAGKVQELNLGDILITRPEAKGCIRASQLGQVKLHYFFFCPDLIWGLLSLHEEHAFKELASHSGEGPRLLKAAEPGGVEFARLVEEARHPNLLAQRCRMLLVAAQVFGRAMPSHNASLVNTTPIISRFDSVITDTPGAQLLEATPQQLAEHCGCSLRHFSRLFRKRFGIPLRSKLIELRLRKAQHLLAQSNTKVIEVALESGYRHLGLFNTIFKKYLGMTPTEWRRRNTSATKAPKAFRAGAILSRVALLLLALTLWAHAAEPAPAPSSAAAGGATNAPGSMTNATARAGLTNAAPAPRTNTLSFELKGYRITGNTILSYRDLEPIFKKYVGAAVTIDDIREAIKEFKLAYWERGFGKSAVVTVPPKQELTNALFNVNVKEVRLRNINVTNNQYFSSNNVVRALPSLRKNVVLNEWVLQRDLDKANANRDRQIYPEIDIDTNTWSSTLNLKVKDQLPLHGRLELNNYSPPNTPELRVNAAAQYNNLWQMEHQLGAQYSFSPDRMKEGDVNFYDKPLVASYSAYYRAPLSFVQDSDRGRVYRISEFGYDEATHRFRPPPAGPVPDLTFFASRSSSDTALNLDSQTVTQPQDFDTKGGLRIIKRALSQTLTINESLGLRFSDPLPAFGEWRSSISLGLDYKRYRSSSLQRQEYSGETWVPSVGDSGPPFDIYGVATPPAANNWSSQNIQYLPFSIAWEASREDKLWGGGTTFFNLNQSFNFAGLSSGRDAFQQAAGSKASGNYYILSPGVTRQQTIYKGWGVRFHADGQWANEPLINNEQFALGGLAGVRGYREGQEYGDTGWRVMLEPYAPNFHIALGEGKTLPIIGRFSLFTDYGQRYLIDPGPGRPGSLSLWGVGANLGASSLNGLLEAKLTFGYPLKNIPNVTLRKPEAEFALSIQF